MLFAPPESLVLGDRDFPELQDGHAAVDFCKSHRSDGAVTPTCPTNIDGHDPGKMQHARAAAMCSKGLNKRVGCEPSAGTGYDPMSAIGAKRTSPHRRSMSAFGGKADMPLCCRTERAAILSVGILVGIARLCEQKTTIFATLCLITTRRPWHHSTMAVVHCDARLFERK